MQSRDHFARRSDELSTRVADSKRDACGKCKIKGRGTRPVLTACLHMIFDGTFRTGARAAALRNPAPVLAFARAVC